MPDQTGTTDDDTIQSRAAELVADVGADAVEQDDVEARLRKMIRNYGVPPGEAARTVRRELYEEMGEEPPSESDAQTNATSTTERVSVRDITSPDRWVKMTVKVVELWEPNSEKVDQVGLVGDDTGRIKFTKWADAADTLPTLEPGAVYTITGAVTDVYNGRPSIKLTKTTEVTAADESVTVPDQTEVTVTGLVVDILNKSGLIYRCPADDCTYTLSDGSCPDHGDVEGTSDLRGKVVLDTGTDTHQVIFDREQIESITRLTLDDAVDRANSSEPAAVEVITETVLGQYFTVTGPLYHGYVMAEEVSTPPTQPFEEVLLEVQEAHV